MVPKARNEEASADLYSLLRSQSDLAKHSPVFGSKRKDTHPVAIDAASDEVGVINAEWPGTATGRDHQKPQDKWPDENLSPQG